jgi:glycosyltransferase involved in cell wall biosynthesis
MKACSFGVSPTLIESFGMAILEANYCHLPMVVFDAGGNREIVTPGENGFLAPYLDVEALIAEAESLFDHDRLVTMRERTLAAVEKKFKQPVILEQLVSFLQQ